jgi:hypothetical protein
MVGYVATGCEDSWTLDSRILLEAISHVYAGVRTRGTHSLIIYERGFHPFLTRCVVPVSLSFRLFFELLSLFR